MTITVIRCCPKAEKSLCPQCVGRLPKEFRDTLVGSYWDGDLLGHVNAANEALTWLRWNPPAPPLKPPRTTYPDRDEQGRYVVGER